MKKTSGIFAASVCIILLNTGTLNAQNQVHLKASVKVSNQLPAKTYHYTSFAERKKSIENIYQAAMLDADIIPDLRKRQLEKGRATNLYYRQLLSLQKNYNHRYMVVID